MSDVESVVKLMALVARNKETLAAQINALWVHQNSTRDLDDFTRLMLNCADNPKPDTDGPQAHAGGNAK